MVIRIISSWYKLGQDQDYPLFDANRNVLSAKRNELIRELAAKSIVLLKNENKTLPLSPGGFISVFGQASSESLRAGVGLGRCKSSDSIRLTYSGQTRRIPFYQWIRLFAILRPKHLCRGIRGLLRQSPLPNHSIRGDASRSPTRWFADQCLL